MCSNYALDSMDRFGDDLCEVLLSYLSFEDRFRFAQHYGHKLRSFKVCVGFGSGEEAIKLLASISQMPALNELVIGGDYNVSQHLAGGLQKIGTNCPKLTKLTLNSVNVEYMNDTLVIKADTIETINYHKNRDYL
ncbi:unnamed protein product, partial [Medioppia subpectinata]